MTGVVGTAGHIDHGKTALVRALTGVDTDRLPEEKARGITIDLGFAQVRLPSGRMVGMVDVPGHERFVRTMVAGAAGFDVVMLVVAADEGVMPQTREHLDICGLLGVTGGVVALSKVDRVDGELRQLAIEELRQELRGSCLENAPIVPCSALTGEGLPSLLAALEAQIGDATRDVSGPLRLPVDRVFVMRGHGTVVTGTLWSGQVAVGDEVELLPSGLRGHVRGVEVHGTAGSAVAGQRTALNVSMARRDVGRGTMVGRPGELALSSLIDVRIRLLPSAVTMKRQTEALFLAGTSQCMATVTLLEPVQSGTALGQIRLAAPMVLLPDDRFVLRGWRAQRGHGTTMGGGVVLRVLAQRRPSLPTLAALEAASGDERVRLEVMHAGVLDRIGLQHRLPLGSKAIESAISRLSTAKRLVRFDKERGSVVSTERLAVYGDRALTAVTAHHARVPLDAGIAKAELASLLRIDDVRLLHLVLESTKGIETTRDVVRLMGYDPARSVAAASIGPLAERIEALYVKAQLAPPRPAEAAVTLSTTTAALEAALVLLTRAGILCRIQDLVFARTALDELERRLTSFLDDNATIAPQQWKAMVGGSRKFAIPLAEYFDAKKVTLRVGDSRKRRR